MRFWESALLIYFNLLKIDYIRENKKPSILINIYKS